MLRHQATTLLIRRIRNTEFRVGRSEPRRLSHRSYQMGKKDKGPEILVDKEALAPWGVELNDMIKTPLGTMVTVIGTKAGQLWVRWPGGLESASGVVVAPSAPQPNQLANLPAPSYAKDKAELLKLGYERKDQAQHIQRAIDQRWKDDYQKRVYGPPIPRISSRPATAVPS